VVEGDCILGHEAAGIVLQCGEGVTDLRPGTSRLKDVWVSCLLMWLQVTV
jgi:L-iditol 2-dehydrogenase